MLDHMRNSPQVIRLMKISDANVCDDCGDRNGFVYFDKECEPIIQYNSTNVRSRRMIQVAVLSAIPFLVRYTLASPGSIPCDLHIHSRTRDSRGLYVRLLFIICESGVETRVTDMLTRVGAPGYTRFTGASGTGAGGIRDGTPVWPGLNSIIMTGVPEAIIPAIMEGIEELETHRGGRLAVKVFSVSAEEYC
jgi:hypothetical protein